MKLYYTKGACSLAVRIIINELGLKCDDEAVDLRAKKLPDGSDYFAVNPKGAVPALKINEKEVLTENAVILQYLADTNKATTLLPPVGEIKRYHVLEWLNYVATELHKSIGMMFNPALPADARDHFLIPNIKAKLNFLNKHLKNHAYLTGDTFTLPDAYFFVMMSWLIYFKFDLNEWDELSRLFKELGMRPSIQQSLKQEGLI